MVYDFLWVVLHMLLGIVAAAILFFGFAFLIFLGDADARGRPLVSRGFDRLLTLVIYASWFMPLLWFGPSLLLLVVAGLFVPAAAVEGTLPAPVRALRLADAIADLEYAIKTHETFKRWFGIWLKVHIVTAFLLYALLGLHVWAGIHFGLRWFS